MQTQPHTHHIPANGSATGADDEWSQTKLRIVAAAGVLVLAAGLVFGMVISTTGDASADPEPATTHGLDQAPASDDADATAEGDTSSADDGAATAPAADDGAAGAGADEPAAPAADPEADSEEDEETPEEDPEDPVDPVDPMDGAPDDIAPVPEDPDPGFDGPDGIAPLPTIPDPTPICCIVLPPVVPDPDPVPPVIDGKILLP